MKTANICKIKKKVGLTRQIEKRFGDHCFRGVRGYTNNTEKAIKKLIDGGSKIVMPF